MDMFIDFDQFAQNAGTFLDFIGVIVILGGVIIASALAFVRLFYHAGLPELYRSYRRNLARSILIGLEFLVAGDIIRSVAGDLNLDSVIILAIIVLVRAFLGMEMQMEMEGRWPWQRNQKTSGRQNAPKP
jgi:uncharacterized membrane protein